MPTTYVKGKAIDYLDMARDDAAFEDEASHKAATAHAKHLKVIAKRLDDEKALNAYMTAKRGIWTDGEYYAKSTIPEKTSRQKGALLYLMYNPDQDITGITEKQLYTWAKECGYTGGSKGGRKKKVKTVADFKKALAKLETEYKSVLPKSVRSELDDMMARLS